VELSIRNRRITPADLKTIRELIDLEGSRGRTHLSRRLCRLWDWRQPNGAFREIACRELLRRLEQKNLVRLPAQLHAARRPGYQNRVGSPRLEATPLVEPLQPLVADLTVTTVDESAQRRLFKELIAAHHYLGYRQPSGPCLSYLVFWQDRPVACARFGPAAWKLEARDRFIGWSPTQRQRHRHQLVNNDRFLILPWVSVGSLASFILSRLCGRLPADWQALYQRPIVLAETFVQADRFVGTCYAAAHWQCVGQTSGRGRQDRAHQHGQPIKSIWLFPLHQNFRHRLTQ
jgi:Druantia protein DruA